MNLKSIQFRPVARVEITQDDVTVLIRRSQGHYDGRCQQACKPGGLIYGIKNQVEAGILLIRLTTQDLDLLVKICEVFIGTDYEAAQLHNRLGQIWYEIMQVVPSEIEIKEGNQP